MFKSYFLHNLNFSREYKKYVCSNPGWGWIEDYHTGEINREELNNRSDVINPNSPFGKRRNNLIGSGFQEFSIPLMTDLSTSKKYLPPGQKYKITLNRSSENFYMITDNNSDELKIILEDVHLVLEKVPLTSDGVKEFQRNLEMKQMKMFFTMNRMKPYTVSPGNTDWGKYEFHRGILPRAIYIAFQTQKAFSGDRTKNPYVFVVPELEQAQIIVNSQPFPYKPLTLSSDTKVALWESFLNNTGHIANESTCVPISYDEYYGNNFMLAWDRSHAKDNGFKLHPSDKGSLSLNLKVRDEKTETMVVIVMMTFDCVLNFEGDQAYVQQI